MQRKRKTLLSWSSGKDSAWALHVLQQDPEIDLVGLFCTVNKKHDRVAMHAVRTELLKRQAHSAALPLDIIEIPYPCSHEEYSQQMTEFVKKCQQADIEYMAFGDLFLEDIRKYREDNLKGTGIKPIFPLWGKPTDELAKEMIAGGLKTVITCIDPKKISSDFSGKEYDESFINDLPESADPCGENGEFHSFVHAGPMFQQDIEISVGQTVERDGFVFTDVFPAYKWHNKGS